jgi:hypothetical protein
MKKMADISEKSPPVNEKSGKTIIVNARKKKWLDQTISFEQLVVLAFGVFQGDMSSIYTVVFKGGEEKKKEGMMVLGDVINVKNNMIFNVTATNKS